ncbi:uncharacterized protein N7482_005540 [Penicillium canariense]|uniref:Uncharacterized protein n=1 Tax=Penicillium canariense TaxID=189055 RepID=A0A9W9I505_9EURO|nr:uncharacterized protein N7482_005540 [Penicillium canariense]KAJ5166759.1 hypothetical protein N7482_005540 [Penicillium canariense]
MPALRLIDRSLAASLHSLAKRSNWASREPGVILVFCIVFLVAVGLLSLVLYRRWMKRKAEKESFETTT